MGAGYRRAPRSGDVDGPGDQPGLFASPTGPSAEGRANPGGLGPPPVLVAATDGSAIRNPGPAAWCWYIGPHSWAAGTFETSTNNIAELTAIERLLLAVPGHVPLEIRSDSAYAINAVTVWSPGWARRGWRTAAGAPVANVGLIRSITTLLAARVSPARFAKVRAHQVSGGDPLNEAADLRANQAARCVEQHRPAVAGPGFPG